MVRLWRIPRGRAGGANGYSGAQPPWFPPLIKRAFVCSSYVLQRLFVTVYPWMYPFMPYIQPFYSPLRSDFTGGSPSPPMRTSLSRPPQECICRCGTWLVTFCTGKYLAGTMFMCSANLIKIAITYLLISSKRKVTGVTWHTNATDIETSITKQHPQH